jgi:hypothetical protein
VDSHLAAAAGCAIAGLAAFAALRGLARRSSTEIDDGIAALGSCVDVS